ncbi:SRPBCC family protein (plasmid) [Pseudochrobactrum algeriensis]|nr:SRPBCC family protein [Pseudochrobactrum algeriensis]QVQ42193.1 SRPBCC family protein [Pseudochrobactrum algeriensis]QVQ42651.1 SRPBCC family protein [Pseudochrobactrum algeriensis]
MRNPMSENNTAPSSDRFWLSIIATTLYAVLLYILIWLIREGSGMAFITGLILMPMAITSLLIIQIDPQGTGSIRKHMKTAMLCMLGFILISMIIFGEAGICVAMAAPFLFAGTALGVYVTMRLLRNYQAKRSVTFVIALPFLALPLENQIEYQDHFSSVTTVIEINAPADVIWNNTLEIPDIRSDELGMTFSHSIVGVPKPEDARITGSGVGAVRHLKWGKGVNFEEVITGWQENRYLRWDFRFSDTSIPKAVEAHISVNSDYLGLDYGEYLLEPIDENRTRLTLKTQYRIATPINIYCDWWGQIFLNDFHSIVLNVIKERSESAVQA